MSVINFPDPSQSPWTNTLTGIIYTYDNGAWRVTGATGFQPTIVATSFSGEDINLTGISTIGNVEISSGIITSTEPSGSITYYGDGSNLTGIDVVNDISPELGGNLDLNSKDITGIGNIHIAGSINNVNATGIATFTGGLITTEFAEKCNDIGNGGTDMAIDLSNGSHVVATLSEPSTNVTFNSGISIDSIGFTLVLTNGADNQAIVWPSNIKWPANTTPSRTTESGKTDILVFLSSDGGANWYGNVAIYNYS